MNASNPPPSTPDAPYPENGFNETPEGVESGSAQPSVDKKKSEAAGGTPVDPQGEIDSSILDALEKMAISLEEIATKSRGTDREEQNQRWNEQVAKNTRPSDVSVYRIQSTTDLNCLKFPEGKTETDVDDVVKLLREDNFTDCRGEGQRSNGLIWGFGGVLVGMAGAFTGLAFAP
ncbi:hypothetical protein V5O48_015496 [Marasmius crinis-equi]|uniref:Uncharacterized protein n=1 Tax=Marasmius crinis-equi TaxID=585013 RepID=A0ABR3EUP2_9AGAR